MKTTMTLAGLIGLCLATLGSGVPAQVLTQNCATWMVRNNTAAPVDDLRLTFTGPAGGSFVLENVVRPPAASGAPPCSTAPYSWACNGGPTIQVFLAGIGINPGQWLCVTVSNPAGVPVLGTADWEVVPGPPVPIAGPLNLFAPPSFVINEFSTAGNDWIELYNYGPSVNVGGYRVQVREDPATTMTIFTFPGGFVIPTCHTVLLRENPVIPAPGSSPTMVFDPTTIPAVAAIPWNLTDSGAVYLIAPAPFGPAGRPVDSLAFGYFQSTSNLHPNFPISTPVQNYTDDDPEQVTLYRMETCLRCDADSWNNQRVPHTVLNGGPSILDVTSATPGCPNPGECASLLGCTGPTGLTLRVSKCPLVLHVDHAVPGSDVFLFISDDLRPTQSSGIVAGLNPFSPLLFSLSQGNFLPPLFQGPANLPSPCPLSGAKETSFGFLPGINQCFELSAYAVVQGTGGGAFVPMVSNVVRIP